MKKLITAAMMAVISGTAMTARTQDFSDLQRHGISGLTGELQVAVPEVPEPLALPEEKSLAGKDGIIDLGGETVCEYSWEERPGTTDYTLWDSYLKRNYPRPDRSQGKTLQGAKTLKSGDTVETLCHNARILKGCFAKANARAAYDPMGAGFLYWASERKVDPVLLRMAIAMQETNLGGLKDSCSGASCNGVGMNQVITIVTDSGYATNSGNRPEWAGITHNTLTNMKYGIRVLAMKISEREPRDIAALARFYNGSPHAAEYARKVQRNYENLRTKCGF